MLTRERATEALEDYLAFDIARYELWPHAHRVWELCDRFTAYDAYCLALAESLGTPLRTCDAKLASGGHDADVRVARRDGGAG